MNGGQLIIRCNPLDKVEISSSIEKSKFYNLAPLVKSARIKAKDGNPTEIRINLTDDCTEDKHPLLLEVTKLILTDNIFEYAWDMDVDSIKMEHTVKAYINPLDIVYRSQEEAEDAMKLIVDILHDRIKPEDADFSVF